MAPQGNAASPEDSGAVPVPGDAGAARKFGDLLALVFAGLALAPVADLAIWGLARYMGPLLDPWQGTEELRTQRPLALVALVLAGAVAVPAARGAVGRALGVAGLAVVIAVVPLTLRLPYGVAVGLLVGGALAALALAVWPGTLRTGAQNGRDASGWGSARVVAGVVAVWLGALGVGLGAAGQSMTIVVLAVLCAAAVVAALWGRGRGVTAPTAVALAAAEVGVVWAAHGLRVASLVCAGAGVAAVGIGVWRRSREIGYVGTGFLLGASWMRLWAESVDVVEAYTLPFSLVLLGIGWWHSRGRPVSSWRAYGAGLVFTFGPSLLAEPIGIRSLALGAAALGVTVWGLGRGCRRRSRWGTDPGRRRRAGARAVGRRAHGGAAPLGADRRRRVAPAGRGGHLRGAQARRAAAQERRDPPDVNCLVNISPRNARSTTSMERDRRTSLGPSWR